jgi:hypothetical protein
LALLLAAKEPPSRSQAVRPGAVVRTVVTRAGIAGLLVALLIGAGFEYFGVSAGPRLVDLSYSDGDLALFYGLLAPAGLALGALAGGTLTDRIGALGGTAASLFVLTGLLAWIAAQDLFPVIFSNHLLWYPLAYAGIGMLTASSYALFMALSRGAFATTRISLFMAMTNACEAWAAFAGGRLSVQGYGISLLILTAAACLAILPLLVLWRELGGISWRGMAQARR